MDTSISVEELADVMRSLGMSSDDASAYKGVVDGMLSGAAASDAFDWPVSEPVERNWVRPHDADRHAGDALLHGRGATPYSIAL